MDPHKKREQEIHLKEKFPVQGGNWAKVVIEGKRDKSEGREDYYFDGWHEKKYDWNTSQYLHLVTNSISLLC